MGCMVNTLGIGSGKVLENSIEIGENRFVDKINKRTYNGCIMFLLWGSYKCPNPNSNNWKKFVDDCRVNILCILSKFGYFNEL